MPKSKKEDLEKVTLNIVKGDKETLATFHANLGWSVAARILIRDYCQYLREEAEDRGLEGVLGNLSLEDLLSEPTGNSPVRSGPEVSG